MEAFGRRLTVTLFVSAVFFFVISPPSLFAVEPLEVVVEGIEGDLLKNVEEMLAIPPGLIEAGNVDRLWLDRFSRQAVQKVRTAIEPFGYYNARVATKIEETGAGASRLLVSVIPGDPIRVSAVTVTLKGPGAEEIPLKNAVASFPLQEGDVLLQPKYEAAKQGLLAQAQELGYLDADFTVHQIRISVKDSAADVHLELETGHRYLFDGVTIQGGSVYPEGFLRRYLAFKPEEPFSYARLGETQLNFTNSERFREVTIIPEKAESHDYRVPVLVELTPSPSKTLRQGIGYGTDTGARFNVRYRDLNMLQRGHELYSNLYLAEHLQGMATGYNIPDATDIRNSTVFQFNLQQEDLSTYTSRLIALELNRNRSFGKAEMGTAYLRVQREGYTVGVEDSDSRLVLPGLRLSGDHYDHPTRPERGYRYSVDLRGTTRWLGSDTELAQIIAAGSFLLPLPARLSLQTRAKAGITLLSDPLNDLPPSLRFFAGGDESVRGYAYQSLGPLDAGGRVVGGKHLLAGSVELVRALFTKWGVSVFYDAGNAFDSFTGVRLFQAVGIGLHYYTAVGALNLSIARQIRVDDPGYRIHFTVGFEL